MNPANRTVIATSSLIAIFACFPALATSAAADCEPNWDPMAGQPGMADPTSHPDDWVQAMTVFDDGTGPALYAGGRFTTAGGEWVYYIARWDGEQWTSVGGGMSWSVDALAVFDDGSGPALYAGGSFDAAGDVDANHIARWDGEEWSPLGSGVDGNVRALAVYDDGSGPALYAGGHFETAGGQAAHHIAKWDGEEWSGIGGTDHHVFALTVYDFEDGEGEALYLSGRFGEAGGLPTSRIARWDGEEFSDLGGGVGSWTWDVQGFDDGSGPALYAAGDFNSVGDGVLADSIARWDGDGWSAVGDPENYQGGSKVLAVYDDGMGPALHNDGMQWDPDQEEWLRGPYRWDGEQWARLGDGVDGSGFVNIYALEVYDSGDGPALYTAGTFDTAGGEDASNIAAWQGCPSEAAPGDLTGDGVVGGADLGILLSEWGACADCDDCPADLTGDCAVGGADLGVLLSNWSG